MKRLFSRLTVLFMAWLAIVASAAAAQADSGIFFGNSHLFIRSANQGFNDWHNSYPWSMAELNGDLYVGTGRVEVTSSIMTFTGGMMGGSLPPLHADTPPLLSEFLAFTPSGIVVTDAAKYEAWRQGSRAEIWRLRWGRWQRVYQARFVPSLLRSANGTYPYETAEIMGFRAMTAFREKDGTRALYAALGGFSFAVSPPLILRSTDGKNWMPVATPPRDGEGNTGPGGAQRQDLRRDGGTVGGRPIGTCSGLEQRRSVQPRKLDEGSRTCGCRSDQHERPVLRQFQRPCVRRDRERNGFSGLAQHRRGSDRLRGLDAHRDGRGGGERQRMGRHHASLQGSPLRRLHERAGTDRQPDRVQGV